MYAPRTACCWLKKKRRSISTFGPVVAPQVTSRPLRPRQRSRLLPDGGADVLEDDVGPVAAGAGLHFLAEVLRVVVQQLVGTELFRLVQLVVGAGHGKDVSARPALAI